MSADRDERTRTKTVHVTPVSRKRKIEGSDNELHRRRLQLGVQRKSYSSSITGGREIMRAHTARRRLHVSDAYDAAGQGDNVTLISSLIEKVSAHISNHIID